jgi:rhodanese-related sulfurtransferase
MKKGLIASLLIGALALTGCSSSASTTNLNSQAFAKKIKEPGITLVDVRSAGEFASGHIQNAINIDVEGMQFDAEIAKLDNSATYALYCHSGRRSAIAVEKMNKAGFTHLFNLTTGISDWAAQGFPVTTL